MQETATVAVSAPYPIDPGILAWLMDGDPAIRWQTQRDLLDAPRPAWQAERRRTAREGWGARLLALQDPDGRWGGGIYSPKWTSTTYTLLTLCDLGLPGDTPTARRGAEQVVTEILGPALDEAFARRLAGCDRCIVGMILRIAAYFGIRDARIAAIIDNLLTEVMPDGAWNCRRGRRPAPHHSSFHTTFNVLEGVREYLEAGGKHRRADLVAAERAALELLLKHRLFRSDKTGAVIDARFTELHFPYRWHYDVLRGLDYFARVDAPRDARLHDAIALLHSHRRADGRWPLQGKYSGKSFFEMETPRDGSRWNTLRALRVLRWWQQPAKQV
jgi:hypothetical protein